MCVRPACHLPLIPESNAARGRTLISRGAKAAIELACIGIFLANIIVWSMHFSVRF